jgi:hypothetical protein
MHGNPADLSLRLSRSPVVGSCSGGDFRTIDGLLESYPQYVLRRRRNKDALCGLYQVADN